MMQEIVSSDVKDRDTTVDAIRNGLQSADGPHILESRLMVSPD